MVGELDVRSSSYVPTETTVEKNKRILIIVENLPVPFDRRVWLESTTLTAAGYGVSVICPQGKDFQESFEVIDGVSIYRYPPPPPTTNKLSYAWEFPYCWVTSLRLAFRVARRECFDAIQPVSGVGTHSP